MPATFEDRLLDELRTVVAARPAPAPAVHRPRRARRVAAAGALAAGAAVVVVVATAGGGTPAWAVDRHDDGSVTVHIASLDDAAGLQRELRAAGVPAVVRAVPTPCDAAPGQGTGTGGEGGAVTRRADGPGPRLDQAGTPGAGTPRRSTTGVRTGPDGVTFTIDPGGVPAGEHLYVTTSGGERTAVAMSVGAAPPDCG